MNYTRFDRYGSARIGHGIFPPGVGKGYIKDEHVLYISPKVLDTKDQCKDLPYITGRDAKDPDSVDYFCGYHGIPIKVKTGFYRLGQEDAKFTLDESEDL